MEIVELVIPREKWGPSTLYNTRTDASCCLGHLAMKTGCTKKDLAAKGYPTSNQAPEKFCAADGLQSENWDAENWDVPFIASGINDDEKMPLEEKESRLKILFGAHGIKLSFTGKHRPQNWRL